MEKVSGLCGHTQPMCMCCTNVFQKKWKLQAFILNLHDHSNFNCWDLRTLPSSSQYIFFFSPWLCFYSGWYRLKRCWCKESYRGWCTISYESWNSPGKQPSYYNYSIVLFYIKRALLPLTSSVVTRCWLSHEDCVCFRTYFMILK